MDLCKLICKLAHEKKKKKIIFSDFVIFFFYNLSGLISVDMAKDMLNKKSWR